MENGCSRLSRLSRLSRRQGIQSNFVILRLRLISDHGIPPTLFVPRIYAHCVYERANTVIQEGVVYRQRHTRERRTMVGGRLVREGPSTPFVRMEREVSGARGWAGCISEKHEIATITPCPRGESYLHWNASRRSVAETHHVERSTGCPDEREKLPWPRAVRKRVDERGSLGSVPFFLFLAFFFSHSRWRTVNTSRRYGRRINDARVS